MAAAAASTSINTAPALRDQPRRRVDALVPIHALARARTHCHVKEPAPAAAVNASRCADPSSTGKPVTTAAKTARVAGLAKVSPKNMAQTTSGPAPASAGAVGSADCSRTGRSAASAMTVSSAALARLTGVVQRSGCATAAGPAQAASPASAPAVMGASSADAIGDAIDRRILGVLFEHGRVSYTELASRVALSQTAVAERVRKMVAAGQISRFQAVAPPAEVGRDLQALVDVELERGSDAEAFEAAVSDLAAVLEVLHVTGAGDYQMRVACAHTRELDRFVRYLKHELGVRRTTTRVVLEHVIGAMPVHGPGLRPGPT